MRPKNSMSCSQKRDEDACQEDKTPPSPDRPVAGRDRPCTCVHLKRTGCGIVPDMQPSTPLSDAALAMSDLSDLDSLFAQLECELAPGGASEREPSAPAAVVAFEERRAADRLPPSELAGDVRLSIRGGADARPIDISQTGILAETTSRLLPGSHVELILQINGERRLLRATIIRSSVYSLGPTLFRTAFKFDLPTTFPERK